MKLKRTIPSDLRNLARTARSLPIALGVLLLLVGTSSAVAGKTLSAPVQLLSAPVQLPASVTTAMTPTGVSTLYGAACVGTACFAVGRLSGIDGSLVSNPLILQSNGGPWVEDAVDTIAPPSAALPVVGRLEGIECQSSTSCIAVGSIDEPGPNPSAPGGTVPLIERLQNGTWVRDTAPSPSANVKNELYSVACTSAACYAVGSAVPTASSPAHPLIEEWNGSTWSVIQNDPSQRGGLYSISCSGSLCMAVGEWTDSAGLHPFADVTTGSGWTRTSLPQGHTSEGATAVSCASSISCTAVGTAEPDKGVSDIVSYTWNGSSWSSSIPSLEGTGNAPAAITCVPGTCWVVGDQLTGVGPRAYQQAWIWRDENGTWTSYESGQTTPGISYVLNGVACGQSICVDAGYSLQNGIRQTAAVASWPIASPSASSWNAAAIVVGILIVLVILAALWMIGKRRKAAHGSKEA